VQRRTYRPCRPLGGGGGWRLHILGTKIGCRFLRTSLFFWQRPVLLWIRVNEIWEQLHYYGVGGICYLCYCIGWRIVLIFICGKLLWTCFIMSKVLSSCRQLWIGLCRMRFFLLAARELCFVSAFTLSVSYTLYNICVKGPLLFVGVSLRTVRVLTCVSPISWFWRRSHICSGCSNVGSSRNGAGAVTLEVACWGSVRRRSGSACVGSWGNDQKNNIVH
jgi:hypothetical protein